MNLLHPPLSEKKTRHQVIINMDEISKRLDRQFERYRKTHCTKYVCPYCNAFLVPWSWNSGKDKEIVEQYTCGCNGNSPAWHVEVIRQLFGNAIVEHSRVWSYLSKHATTWTKPKEVPTQFNPSVRR